MSERPETEPIFYASEQSDILKLAARLQEECGSKATLTQLQAAALEAGIEPTFVRQAAEMLRNRATATAENRPEGIRAYSRLALLGTLFLVVQFWIAWLTLYQGRAYDGSWATIVSLGLTLGLLFGIGTAHTRKGRLGSAVIVLASAIGAFAVTGLFLRLTGGNIHSDWTGWFGRTLLVECGALVVGHVLARGLRWYRRAAT